MIKTGPRFTAMTAPLPSTIRQEAEAGRRHTPDFAWRTLLLEVELFLIFIAATVAALAGFIPMWLGMIGNTVFIYALYTVVHEAVHANISSRRRSLAWVDTLAGVTACLPLWLNFHQHRRQHMVHHARTNEDDDPDIYARGGFWGWLLVRLPLALVGYFNPVQQYRDCRRFGCTRQEYVFTFLGFSAGAALVAAILAMGYWKELLLLWFVPWWIGQTIMLTFFTWTPHHDHHETGRYRNTRISLFPFANILLQGQNYHLIHHMMPGIPHYRYKPVFEELRPVLEARGVRIEGIFPDPRNEGPPLSAGTPR
ncbi:fatty acid desaturase family protein [Aestuariivirga sp.]|uniref:fatty acid desaturase family protein n=1 Tax=Aestuariivirga sp. TaxID=2650926 RepID=UPI00378371AB